MVTDSALLLHLQTEVLEAVARGERLHEIADLLCRRAEALAPGAFCSILVVDDAGLLQPLAAPSLPASFSAALVDLPAGPRMGSCGTAAYRNQPVIVTDIDNDPLWDDFRGLVQPLGLRACWSSPIRGKDGQVVATFAIYYRTCRGPNVIETDIVQTCLHLCALAIDHDRVREHSHRLAYYDALTDLPNRSNFVEMLAQAVARQTPFGLLLVDIDHLKIVNDTVGHVFGDLMIRTIAQRISKARPDLLACRLGGDEFAILVPQCTSETCLSDAAHSVIGAVRGLIQAEGQTIDPHVTLGGALFGPDGIDGTALRQNADFALYHAKEIRRGGYVRFTPELRTSMLERARMVRDVDLALVEGRILAHYQPIVRLDTAEIVGLEALARMRMPDGRIAGAGEFHAAFADPRIAWQLTDQILKQVAADVRHWLDLGIDFQHVGINVTSGDFLRGDLEQRVVKTFGEASVPLHHVALEVNEAVFMGGSDLVPKTVRALRQRGVLVALDDFGTGFASLTHLLSFPVDVIKIDKSFIDRLGTDLASAAIVGCVIEVARKLNMAIVAEGIESADQAAALSGLDCKLGQGFLYARPCSASDATQLLRAFAQKRETPGVSGQRSA